MTSLLAERLGSQEPVVCHLPPDVHSLAAAEEAIELADSYGICDGHPLVESQKITIRGAGGERADGTWAATRVADFGPRQGTGKSDKINAWELAHLLLFGTGLILHTAHEFQTANEAFLRLVAVFDAHDDLSRRVARIRYANGEQGIELLTGQRLKYRARTGGSGRGFAKAGLLVYDEAQHLSREHVAASGPSKLANPNSQTWYAGSGGMSSSSVAWEIRRAAILGTGGRLAYTEMTAEHIEVIDGKIRTSAPDPADRDGWYRAMSGLGRWVTEEGMVALYDELGPERFARECECVWDPEPGTSGGAIFSGWGSLAGPAPEHGKDVGFALDVAPDHSTSTITSAWTLPGGSKWVQVADHRPGVDWVVARWDELRSRWGGTLIVEQTGTAGFLLPRLESAEPVSRRFFVDACSTLADAISSAGLRHGNQPELNGAVDAARWSSSGDAGQRVLARKDPRVSPLVAAALALHGLTTTTTDGGWVMAL